MTQPSAFFDRLYDNARDLTVEARNYIAFGSEAEKAHLTPELTLEFSKESTRLTSRLVEIMAWVLTEKAVHAGEITRDEADTPALRLTGMKVNMDPNGHENPQLPIGLRDLLQRSYSLYEQVVNLDKQSKEILQFQPTAITRTDGRPFLVCINNETLN